MKKWVFMWVAFAFALASCGDGADKVNRSIIGNVESVNQVLAEISSCIANDDYEAAKVQVDSLIARVATSTSAVGLLNNKKAGVFKQSALDYLGFVAQEAPATYTKAIGIFEQAKIREAADKAAGKQDPNKINFGEDFDEGRKVLKDFARELRKMQSVVIEKQNKFKSATGLK